MLVMVTKELVTNVDKKNVLLELQELVVCVQVAQQQPIKMKLVKQVASNALLVLGAALLQ